ncbi:MAG: hypothetical protein LBN33_02940, partial [Desulfovibrio sp.]|nr:hypothetical protein [Desulfovibrio sp.]
MKHLSTIIAAVFAILGLTAFNAAAADKTYYVSAETGGSIRSADGSKEKPWKDLQAALDKAEEGSTILIAQGNYLGTSDRGYLEMLKPVNLKGGYSSDFSKRDVLAHRTVIQPTAAANGTSGSFALLNLGKKGTVNG